VLLALVLVLGQPQTSAIPKDSFEGLQVRLVPHWVVSLTWVLVIWVPEIRVIPTVNLQPKVSVELLASMPGFELE